MNRKPIAITGASRDLSERQQAEELQRLLANELNHRVVKLLGDGAVDRQPDLRGAEDIEAARRTLDARIVALAGAHDLPHGRSWSGADLTDLVAHALAPFTTRVKSLSMVLQGTSCPVRHWRSRWRCTNSPLTRRSMERFTSRRPRRDLLED